MYRLQLQGKKSAIEKRAWAGGDTFLRNVGSHDLHGSTSQKTAFLIFNLLILYLEM
jgi:hypothetical protein